MRKPIQFVLAAVIVVLIAATGILYSKYQRSTADYTDMKTQEETARSHYGEAINSIAEIQDSLNAIMIGNQSLGLTPSEMQSEGRLSPERSNEALNRIALLKASIERTKVKIQDLDSRLHKSGVKVAGLEKMVANLKKDVADKEGQITMLTAQVDSLNTRVTGLVTEVQENQDTIRTQAASLEDRRRELDTIYYLIGDKHALTQAGAVVAKGGVLGLGKTLQPSGTANESMFTAMDIDQDQVIRIPSAKARVLSAQPITSYTLQPDGNQMELHILDPKEFRKVKHVVILT